MMNEIEQENEQKRQENTNESSNVTDSLSGDDPWMTHKKEEMERVD